MEGMRGLRFLVLLALLLAASTAAGDPAVTQPSPTEGLAQWTFSNPVNYTLANVVLGPGGASLAWSSGSLIDSSAADFGSAGTQSNLDLTTQPGDVLIADTSMPGPLQSVDMPNTAFAVSDNYILASRADINFGADPSLPVGFFGANVWTRSILQFPLSTLPANATVRSATLLLYMNGAATNDAMAVGLYRITSPWTEFGSTWDFEDGVTEWNSTINATGGGDFDPSALDVVPGITDVPGWYAWNATAAVTSWWTGVEPNQGLLLRQVDDDQSNSLGQKYFSSSDATNASARPRLAIAYTTPSSFGRLESRVLDPGGRAAWTNVAWNASLPSGTSLSIQTRSGTASVPDGTWSPWSPAYVASGVAIVSPIARYLQYRATLVTPNAQSPTLSDMTIGFARHPTLGSVTTEPFAPVGAASWGVISMNLSRPTGTAGTLGYSVDGGFSWTSVASGEDISAAPLRSIQVRITLSTSNTTESPAVDRVSVSFALVAATFPGALFVLPYSLGWLALLAVPVWLILRRAFRAPFRPSAAFLIHEDGRLLARAGAEGAGMRDELASSGMFAVVAKFVKDSFTPGSSGAGELKSLQVDDRHVSIAKEGSIYLAIVSTGERPRSLPDSMAEFLAALRAADGRAIAAWDGFRDGLADVEARLRAFLEGFGASAGASDNSQPR